MKKIFFKKINDKNLIFPGLLIVFGLVSRLAFLDYPAIVVFDETHFGGFVNSYFIQKSYFDIHPPLGKLIIYLFTYLGGYGDFVKHFGDFKFAHADDYGATPYLIFRYGPALAGSLIPLIFYYLLRQIKLRPSLAFLGGCLLLLENSFVVQARFILLDSFLVLFGLLGLLVFLNARNNNYSWKKLFLAGIFLSASVSTKWTGLCYLAIVFLILFFDYGTKVLKVRFKLKKMSSIALKTAPMLVGRYLLLIFSFLLFYISIFFLHFSLMPDDHYDTVNTPGKEPEFKNQFLPDQWVKLKYVYYLNKQMFISNSRIRADHPYSSRSYTWPIMQKPVLYFSEHNDQGRRNITFQGNPIVWLAGILGILGAIVFFPKIKQSFSLKGSFLLGYVCSFLPFILIKRPLFLYSYMNALTISIILFMLVCAHWLNKLKSKKLFYTVYLAVLVPLIASFFIYASFTYGSEMSHKNYRIKTFFLNWTKKWVAK
ncbi:MAG: phospholipid carrier-dependent glycosyltransferase [Candidatus Moranbacteria bacterium]|nr:phospholipid carrier-dependent glycosyltransferase [Candidatus Moranbacteria bacterium]